MTNAEIQELIKKDETRTLELKKSTGELKDAMHTVCAFLNTSGGCVLLGITSASLQVIGQQVTDNTRREIARELTKIEPAVSLIKMLIKKGITYCCPYLATERHSNFYVLLFLYDCLYTLGVDTKLPLLKMLHLTDQIPPSAYLPPLYAFLPDNNYFHQEQTENHPLYN